MPTTVSPSSEAFTESLKIQLSSNYDQGYERSKFMTIITSDYDGSLWIDPLDQNLLNILAGDISYDIFSYRSESITTISYNYYKNTSLWWLIVMFNGFIHPHEIPSGYKLKIPKLEHIVSRLKKPTKESIKGKVVRV